MWNKLTGKDSDVASSSSKRRSTSDRSDREKRERRAESIVTSASSRAPPSSARDDKAERRVSRSSTFPLEEQRSGASSYATAPSERQPDSDTTSRRSHRREKDKKEEKTQYRVTERGAERIRGDSPSPERRKSSKRDSSREREKSKEERREQRRRERARAEDDDNRSSSHRKSRSSADQETSRGPEDFPGQIAGAGFSQFPGQGGAPSQGSHSISDAHVANQFPGQQPAYSWHDAKTVSEGGVGLAAEYYGDQGQSVGSQPGYRPHTPNMLVNADAHLIAASATANPAQDTGNGAAADFYSGKVSPVPFAPTTGSSSHKPSKSGKKPSSSSSSLAGAAALASTAAAGYALSQGGVHKPSKTNGSSSSIYQQGTNVSMTTYHSESTPALPTMSSFSEAGPSNSRPGKHSSHGSNVAAYAAGAAALGAAGAYALHEHHEHDHNKPSGHGSRPTNSNTRPNRPMYSMSDGSFVMNQYGGGPNGMMMEHQHRGPVSRLVDWWKDHEDVRKMEAYTQELGVCRYCFDPQSSVYDAPRKHHYNRRRRSKESLVSGRVEKQSRYGYASDEDKGWGVGNWIGAGLAGYGVAKVGKTLLGNNRDFDDTYSVKTGRRLSDMNDSRISLVSRGSRRGSDSDGRRRSYSRQSEGVIRHKSDRRSDASIAVDVHGDGSKEYASVRRKKSHRSGSRSSSGSRRGSKSGALGAGLGLAAGAVAAHELGKQRRHSRSRSPAVRVKHKNRSRSRSSDRTHRRRSSHSKKKAGFFTWGNESSSSTDSALVYGFNVPRKKSSVKSLRSTAHASSSRGVQKKIKHKSSDEKLNATLAGLAATGAAITAVQMAKRGGRRHNADLVAVKEKKGQKRANDALLGVPGKRSSRSHRRTRSGASAGSSSSSSLSIASWRDETAVDDDGWEDESEIGKEDLPSPTSSDDGFSGLAYGDDHRTSRKARKSTDSLVSDAGGTDKWFWRWGGKNKSKRRSSDIEASHGSGLGTAATMAGALAAGAAVTSMSDKREKDRKSVQFEQRPQPTPLTRKQDEPSEVSSFSGSMHTVYPTATSDPYNFDAVAKPTRANTFPLQQPETTVYTSRPELKQPQPLSQVRESVYTTQADYQPTYPATAGPPVFSQYDIKQPVHPDRRESYAVSPGGSDVLKDIGVGVAAAAAVGGVAAVLTKDSSEKEARRRRKEEDEAYADRVRRKGEEDASELRRRQKREAEDMERLKRTTDKRTEDEHRSAKDVESQRQQYDREMAARAETALRDQQAKDAFEAERKAHYESERAERKARRAEAELAEAERVAREAVLADHERRRRTSDAERASSAREVRHDEHADDHKSWTTPLAAAAGAAVVGAVVADMASNRGDRFEDTEHTSRDVPAVAPTIAPEHVIAVTPNKVVIDMDDNKDVEDALNDPDFFTKLAAKNREVADHVSPSNAPVYTPIARPRSRSEVFRDLDDRYKDVNEVVNNEEFWAPEELKHRSGQGAKVEESEAKRDGPNADVVFDNYPGSVNPPYFDVRDGSGRSSSGHLDWVPRLNLIPPTPPPSSPAPPSPASAAKRDAQPEVVAGAEKEAADERDAPRAAERSVEDEIDETRPSHRRRSSAQSHSIGEVHVEEPDEPPTPPSVARKPTSSRVSFGGSEVHNYEVPSPEPSILEGHEGHFPKLDLDAQAEQGASRDLPTSADREFSFTKSQSATDVETPVEEEIVTEGAAHLAESARDSPYFPHDPKDYEEGRTPDEAETPIYESISPERTPVYEDADERGSFYQQPFYDTVSDIGLGGETPRRPGFVIGEVETPHDERRDPVKSDRELPTQEAEEKYMPSMPGAFDDEAAPSTSREAPAEQMVDEVETPADDIDEFAGLSKKERKKAEKAKARRTAELAAAGAAGIAAASVLTRDAPAARDEEADSREDAEEEWFEAPKKSKKKSKSKTKTNGASYDEPAAPVEDKDTDLPRGRYDYQELERREQQQDDFDVDDEDLTDPRGRRSLDREAEDSPAPSKSESRDERKKSKRRTHEAEADEFIDEEYSHQVSAAEPKDIERDIGTPEKSKRKKSSRRSGDDFDDGVSTVSSKSKYDDEEEEKKSRKKEKRSSLASLASSLIGGGNDSPSSKKDRDVDGTSEVSSRSRSSKNDDEDDDRRGKRKKEKRKSRSEVDEDESFLGGRAEESKMAPLPLSTVAAAGPAPVSMPSFEPEPVSGPRQARDIILPDVGSEGWEEAMQKLANESERDGADEAAEVELPASLPPSPTPEEKTFEAGVLADLQSSLARQRDDNTALAATAFAKPTPPRPAPINTSRTFSPTSVPVRFRRPPRAGHGRSNSVDPDDWRTQGIENTSTATSSPLAEASTRSTPRHSKSISAESPVSASFRTNTQEMRPLYLVERNRYRNSWSGPDSSALGRELETLPSLPSSRASSELGSEEDVRREISTPGWEDAVAGEGHDDFFSAHGTPEWRTHSSFSEHGTPDRSGGDFFSAQGTPEKGDQEEDWLDSQQATPRATQFDPNIFDKYQASPAVDASPHSGDTHANIEPPHARTGGDFGEYSGPHDSGRSVGDDTGSHAALTVAAVGGAAAVLAAEESCGDPYREDRDRYEVSRPPSGARDVDDDLPGQREMQDLSGDWGGPTMASEASDPLLQRASVRKDKKQGKGKKKGKKGKPAGAPSLADTAADSFTEGTSTPMETGDDTAEVPFETRSSKKKGKKGKKVFAWTDDTPAASNNTDETSEVIQEAEPTEEPTLQRDPSPGELQHEPTSTKEAEDTTAPDDRAMADAAEADSGAFEVPSKKGKKKSKKARKAAQIWDDDEAPVSESEPPTTSTDVPSLEVVAPAPDERDERPKFAEALSEASLISRATSRGGTEMPTPTIEKDDPFSSTAVPLLSEHNVTRRPILPHAFTTPAPFSVLTEDNHDEFQDAQSGLQPMDDPWEEPLEDSVFDEGQQKGFIIEQPDVIREPLEEPYVEDGQQKGFILPESVPLPEDEMDLADLEEQIEILDEQLHPEGSHTEGSPVSVRIPEGEPMETFEYDTTMYPAAVVPHSLANLTSGHVRASNLEAAHEVPTESDEVRMMDQGREEPEQAIDEDALRNMLTSTSPERVDQEDALEELKQRLSAQTSRDIGPAAEEHDARLLSDIIPEKPADPVFDFPRVAQSPNVEEVEDRTETEAWQPPTKKKKGKKGKRGSTAAVATLATVGASALALTRRAEAEDEKTDANTRAIGVDEHVPHIEPDVDSLPAVYGTLNREDEGPYSTQSVPDDSTFNEPAEVAGEQPAEADEDGFQMPTKKTKKEKRKEKRKGKAISFADEDVESSATDQREEAQRDPDRQSTPATTTLDPVNPEDVPAELREETRVDSDSLEKEEKQLPQPTKKSKKEKRKDKKKAVAFDWDEPEERSKADQVETEPAAVEPHSNLRDDEVPRTGPAVMDISLDDAQPQSYARHERQTPETDPAIERIFSEDPTSGVKHEIIRYGTLPGDSSPGRTEVAVTDMASVSREVEPLKQDLLDSNEQGLPADEDSGGFSMKKTKKDKRKEKKKKAKEPSTSDPDETTPDADASIAEVPADDRTIPTVFINQSDPASLVTTMPDASAVPHHETRDFIYGDLSEGDQRQAPDDEFHHEAASPTETRDFIYGPSEDVEQQEILAQEPSVGLTNPFLEPIVHHETDSEKVSPKTTLDLQTGHTDDVSDVPLPPSEGGAETEMAEGHLLSTARPTTSPDAAIGDEDPTDRGLDERSHELEHGLHSPLLEHAIHDEDTEMPDWDNDSQTDRTERDRDLHEKSARDLSPREPTNVDFAATLAAGLEESGMDPNIVLRDSSYYSKPPSPPGQGTMFDDEYSPPPRNRRRGRASRTPSVQSLRAEQEVSQRTTSSHLEGTFDDALALGLTSTGFDAAKVMEVVGSSGRQSPRDIEDPEPGFTLSKKKKKKDKKGRQDIVDDGPLQSESSEYRESFEPSKMAKFALVDQDLFDEDVPADSSAPPLDSARELAETANEPAFVHDAETTNIVPAAADDEWSLPTKKQKKKKGKRGRLDEPSTPMMENDVESTLEREPLEPAENTLDLEEDVVADKARELVDPSHLKENSMDVEEEVNKGVNAEPEPTEDSTWTTSSKSKGKKGKKGKKSSAGAASGRAPTGLLAAAATSLMLATDDAPSKSSKKGKKGKKGKETPVAWNDEGLLARSEEDLRATSLERDAAARKIQHAWKAHHARTTSPPVPAPNRWVSPDRTTRRLQAEPTQDLEPEEAARRIQSAWRTRAQRRTVDEATRDVAEDSKVFNAPIPGLTDDDAARRIQSAWRMRAQRRVADEPTRDIAEEPVIMDTPISGLTDDHAARRIQKAWRQRRPQPDLHNQRSAPSLSEDQAARRIQKAWRQMPRQNFEDDPAPVPRLSDDAAARKIQRAWRGRPRQPITGFGPPRPALTDDEAARKIQKAWRGRPRQPVARDQRHSGFSDDIAARKIQKAWRAHHSSTSSKRPLPQHRESTFTEFEEDLEDDHHDAVRSAILPSALAAAGAMATHSMLEDERGRRTSSPEPMDRPRSSQDIHAAHESTWSFPANRDSAIQVSPVIPESARRSTVRDSGFHEISPTPSSKHDRERGDVIERSAGSPVLTGTTTSSADPLRVSVEVGSDWDLRLSNPNVKTTSGAIERSRGLSDIDEITSPLQSATKPRASEPFNSSPSTREFATPDPPRRQAPRTPHDENTRGLHHVDSRDHEGSAGYHEPPHSGGLHTIAEHVADTSPLAKKSRRLSDVGTPDHAIKAVRRTETPDHERSLDHVGREKHTLPRLATDPHAGATASMDELIARKSWPHVDEDRETVDVDRGHHRTPGARYGHDRGNASPVPAVKQRERVMSPADRVRSPGVRSPSVLSDHSNGSLSRFRTPEYGHQRTMSNSSQGSTHSLRRVDRSISGDLRAKSRAEAGSAKSPLGPTSPHRDDRQQLPTTFGFEPQPGARALDKGKGRAIDMGDTLEAVGAARGSPMSPTRPPSLRKRQSNHIMDLESKVEQFTAENRQLQERLAQAQHEAQLASQQLDVHSASVRTATDDVRARDLQLSEKDAEIAHARTTLQALQEQLARLQEENEELHGSHRELAEGAEGKYAALEAEHARTHQSWQESSRELDELRDKHQELSGGMEELVHQEIAAALADRNEEIKRLNEELESALGQIKMLQQQILESRQGESFLSVRDEDYFDSACQQLCQHVQQWVLKFSKFSDGRQCRLSSDLEKLRDLKSSEREKLEDRLDTAILDGSDADQLLADRIQRRDVFMSLVMSMLWEHVFTRYLFGMDRDQRQKLKTLEKTLTEIGPKRAVAQWRAITLTLLAKRPSFQSQRNEDTEAVMWAIYTTLSTLLPPPKALEAQVQDQLRKVIRLAVDLSIEMRTQRAEYIMLQPLQPEYDTNGDLVQKVPFNAALMNERSGDKEVTNNEEYEQRGAFVKIMLFPLVVKKGDDLGEGEDEVVICPAQVLVAKPKKGKNVRVLSGAVDMDPRRSMQSVMPPDSVDMSAI